MLFGVAPFRSAAAQKAPDAAGSTRSNPTPQSDDLSIRHVSGGTGLDERAELEAVSSQYNLRLIFASQGGGEDFPAVQVAIQDAQGATLLTAESMGPWLFLPLPTGNYVVEMVAPPELQQLPQRKTIHVGAFRQSRLSFFWR